MVGLFLPPASQVEANTETSLNFFYDNLSPYGSWIDVDGYGYCFQPNVAVDNADWRPYADGYWAYTDVGWTWVSYEDFGWATYHYGRWTDLADYGWVWVPGYEWGPAWVSWRTGGDYIGWAPLPPVGNVVYEGRAITGQVDVLFDIGPLYYNFCDVRYIGEPVLRGRIFAPSRNVTIINQTINVTNITYNNSTVYNYGPNYNRLNQYSARPIQRLTLQRETTGNFSQGGKRGNLNRVNGNQLTVVAPAIQKSQQQIAPKQVKAKVEKPKIEHGWQGVQNRKQLQEEMNAENVPPPSFPPKKGRKDGAASAGRNGASQPNEAKGPSRQGQENAKVESAEERNARRENVDQAGHRSENARPANDQANRQEQEQADGSQEQEARQANGQQEKRAQQVKERNVEQVKQQQQERARQAEERRGRESDHKQQLAEEARNKAGRAQQAEESARAQQRARQAREGERAARAKAQEAERSKTAGASQPAPGHRQQARPPQQAQQEQRPNAEEKGKKKKKPNDDGPQG